MSNYKLEFSKKAEKRFRKIDSFQSERILSWLYENIEGCTDPRVHGKPLNGKYQGLWRYRVGKYRVLVKIEDEKLVVLALEVNVRGSVY